jgi:hypothetical protein
MKALLAYLASLMLIFGAAGAGLQWVFANQPPANTTRTAANTKIAKPLTAPKPQPTAEIPPVPSPIVKAQANPQTPSAQTADLPTLLPAATAIRTAKAETVGDGQFTTGEVAENDHPAKTDPARIAPEPRPALKNTTAAKRKTARQQRDNHYEVMILRTIQYPDGRRVSRLLPLNSHQYAF